MKKLSYCFAFLLLLAIFSQAVSSQQPPSEEPPANVAGKWILYCNDPNGSTSSKYLDLEQDGNNIKGHFKGPNQSGGVEGTIDEPTSGGAHQDAKCADLSRKSRWAKGERDCAGQQLQRELPRSRRDRDRFKASVKSNLRRRHDQPRFSYANTHLLTQNGCRQPFSRGGLHRRWRPRAEVACSLRRPAIGNGAAWRNSSSRSEISSACRPSRSRFRRTGVLSSIVPVAWPIASMSHRHRETACFASPTFPNPITAVAIFSLTEAGKLNLPTTSLALAELLGTKFGKPPYKTYVTDITVDHLAYPYGWRMGGGRQ